MKPLFTVDLHHEVLPFWALIRKGMPSPPAVWTLDFHSDLMPCFRGSTPPPRPGEWEKRAAVENAVRTLRHDEHIDWALKAELIGRWELLCYLPPALPPADERMCCHVPDNFPAMETILNDPEKFLPSAEQVLESSFLAQVFGAHLPSAGIPYILDIDCDYFLCEKALFPRDETLFDLLVQNAAAVTLSRESDWVRVLKLRGESITGESVAGILEEKIRKKFR